MAGAAIVEPGNLSGSPVIDSVLQQACQGAALISDRMNSAFPVPQPGQNAISWTGTATRAAVRPNRQNL